MATLQNDYSLDIDSNIQESNPNNYGSSDLLFVSKNVEHPTYETRTVFAATLQTPPTGGGEITKIQIGFMAWDMGMGHEGQDIETDLHRLIENEWGELSCTWIKKTATNDWDSPGAGYYPEIIDTKTIPSRPSGGQETIWFTVFGAGAINPIVWNWGETQDFVLKASASCATHKHCHMKSRNSIYPQLRPILRVFHEPPVREFTADTKQVIHRSFYFRSDTKQAITNSTIFPADTKQAIQGPEEIFRADTRQSIFCSGTLSLSDVIVKIRDPFFLPRLLDNLPRFVVRNDLLEQGILKPIAEAMDEFRAFSNSLPDYAFGDHD